MKSVWLKTLLCRGRQTISLKKLLLASLFALMPIASAVAQSTRPYRGSVQWSVLLCKFSDSSTPSKTPDFYYDMFIRQGTGGLNDYWQSISSNGLNLNGSVIKGWYTEPFTLAQAQSRSRSDRFQDCINAARNSPTNPYTVPSGQLVAVITYPDLDLFGWPGRGAFLPSTVDVGAMGHEVGHGLGLNHSFSDDPNYRNADWAQIGEYDDQWDLMSYANVFSTATSRFGFGGPGLNAHHVDRMGWLPIPRILTFGADGISSRTVTLAALNHREAAGYLLVRIPFDTTDPFHYYTVEFRRNDKWDAGFPNNIVLIHEVKRGSDGQYYSYLLRGHSGERAPIQTLNANGVTITVNSIWSQTNQATVTITSNNVNAARSVYGPNTCKQGYVWREADSSDYVCVTPATRTQARNDNAQAAARRNPNGGPYGPDTCIQGYVWREAFPGDHVCVTPNIRSQARSDNQQAGNRLLKP